MRKHLSYLPRVMPTCNIAVSIPPNSRYARNQAGRLLIKVFLETLVALISRVGPRTILDVGCAEGLVIRQLGISWPAVELYGVDIDIRLLRVAQDIASTATYLVANAYQLPLRDRYYDLVICTEVLEHLEDPRAAMAEILRVAKGHCLISVPNEPWWRIANMMRGAFLADCGNTPGHINHWSRQGFIKFLDNYLDVVTVQCPFPWVMVLGRVRSAP
jgi:SAM-dependent methyltransferase